MSKMIKVQHSYREGNQYVLWLECGHIRKIKIVMDNETDAEKRPPKKVKCKQCLR